MKYRIVWKKSARDELANIWLASTIRNAVTRASDQLDKRLQNDAHEIGESREDMNLRITFERPLAIFFRVDRQAAKVTVFQIKKSPIRD